MNSIPAWSVRPRQAARSSKNGADATIVAATAIAANTRLRRLLTQDRGANDRIPVDPLNVRKSTTLRT